MLPFIMFGRNLVLITIFCVATVFSLPQGRDGNVTSEESNSTETEVVSNQGLLLAGLNYFLGENGHKLLFHEDSPVQYALNFDYLPLVSSITTILNFISSETSPGYVLATYDYAQFLSRLPDDINSDLLFDKIEVRRLPTLGSLTPTERIFRTKSPTCRLFHPRQPREPSPA